MNIFSLKATDGFHTTKDNKGRVTCTKIKLFCILMMKCYDKSTAHFLPFAKLDPKKKAEVGSLMRTTIDDLLDEMKTGKSGVEMMDFLMFRAGVKKAMLQKELNELFTSGNLHMNFLYFQLLYFTTFSAYRFMSEGLNWTTPTAILDEDADVAKIQVNSKHVKLFSEVKLII